MKKSLLIAGIGVGPRGRGGFSGSLRQRDDTTTTTAAATEHHRRARPTPPPPPSTRATARSSDGTRRTRWATRSTVPQEEFANAFNAAQDKYFIELHASGQLMGMGDQFDGVQSKAIEVAEWPIAVFGSVVPEFNLAELPFAVNSIEADAAYNVADARPSTRRLCAKYNMKTVFNFTCQGLDVVSVEPGEDPGRLERPAVPDHLPGDRQRRRSCWAAPVWPWTSPRAIRACRRRSSTATLQSGSFVNMFKLYEVAKNVTRGYLTPAAIGVFINLDVYNAMPDDIKNDLRQAGRQDSRPRRTRR